MTEDIELRELLRQPGTQGLKSLPFIGLPGYVYEGWSHIMVADPKGGKTTLLFRCVADWCARGKKVYWLTEEPDIIWHERGRGSDWEPGKFWLGFPNIDPPERLLERVLERQPDVVVVDSLRRMLDLQDENDNSELMRALKPWQHALTGLTRIYVHHSTKSGGARGKAIAGGSALFAQVDRALEILPGARENQRRVRVYSRLVTPPDVVYELNEAGRLSVLQQGVVGPEKVRDAILRVLGGAWLTVNELHDLLPSPRPSLAQVRRALEGLRGDGVERDPEADRKGATYRWRLEER